MKALKNKLIRTRGFTLVELIVVMALLTALIGFSSINLVNSQHRVNVSSTVDLLVADIWEQQTKAMAGDKSLNSSGVTGIYFEEGSYTLFQRPSYSQSDPTRFVVSLPSSLKFSEINLPFQTLLFASSSGEIIGYSEEMNNVVISDTGSTETKTITINKYGVVTGVD